MKKKIVSVLLAATMVVSMLTACGAQNEGGTKTDGGAASASVSEDGVTEFTAFFAVPGAEINDGNEIQEIIAEKTGVKVKETWLTGQTQEEAIGTLIAGGEYPDFLEGGNMSPQLYEAGALVALDDLIEKYPNVKDFFTEQEWDQCRQDDGHIYWIPQFSNIYGQDRTCTHNDEAFWIQTRVLEWAGYPQVQTLDEYFDLIEAYNEANPTLADGTENIPYTILCEDWRYFCLENAPEFLDGYPNDGSCIVDPATKKVIDYNTTDTAVRYFKKLNEEYKKGIVDPESFTQTYDEYIAKISSGRVLGMVDQWWDFAYTGGDAIKAAGLGDQGCNYVPLPITIDKGIKNQWHNSGSVLNVSSGLCITVSCKDPDKAMKFVSDLLDQEIHDLRFWGREGIEYEVGDDGMYYRTTEQIKTVADATYKADSICTYSYFPQYIGTSHDGKNAMKPDGQESMFFDTLEPDVAKCFEAYGAKTYVDMIGTSEAPGPWYPMWTFSNNFNTSTEGGTAWTMVSEVKHEYLPKVVMADDFAAAWDEYMVEYNNTNPQAYISELQAELDKRIEAAAKYN